MRKASTDESGGGPRNFRNCGQSCCLSVTFRPSFCHCACTAVAISLCPGALLKISVMSFTGFVTLFMYCCARVMFAVAGRNFSVLIDDAPEMPAGVKFVAGT